MPAGTEAQDVVMGSQGYMNIRRETKMYQRENSEVAKKSYL